MIAEVFAGSQLGMNDDFASEDFSRKLCSAMQSWQPQQPSHRVRKTTTYIHHTSLNLPSLIRHPCHLALRVTSLAVCAATLQDCVDKAVQMHMLGLW